MAKIELRIAAPIWGALCAYHLDPAKRVEALSYVFAEMEYVGRNYLRILVPHTAPLFRFAPDCFESQAAGHVRLRDDVQRGLLIAFARSHLSCLINIHDHWFDAHPVFSSIDDGDDLSFDRYLRQRFEPALPQIEGAVARRVRNVAIVLGREGAAARIINTRPSVSFLPVTHITVVGDRHRTITTGKTKPVPCAAPDGLHSRHGDFIGEQHQAALKSLHAVVVGCGGTGSILAEALGRIGIGALTLVDGDTLDATNLNRWQGGEPGMIGKRKARLLAERLRRMFPGLPIYPLTTSVFDASVDPYLRKADVLFGAVDDDAPRLFLNRVALQQLTPYFDVGVAVTVDKNAGIDFRSRAFAVYPGSSACLECTAFALIDRERAAAALLDPATASEWRKAGYVAGQPDAVTPSVYALNQRAVGLVVTEVLNWICAWRPAATVVSESWRRGTLERADRLNFPERPDPACPVCGYLGGSGSHEPLPRPGAKSVSLSQPQKEPTHA